MTNFEQRRRFLGLGITGLAATQIGSLAGYAVPAKSLTRRGSFGRARSVIVVFCWGGMSHIDTFDMKPEAGSEDQVATIESTLRVMVPTLRCFLDV